MEFPQITEKQLNDAELLCYSHVENCFVQEFDKIKFPLPLGKFSLEMKFIPKSQSLAESLYNPLSTKVLDTDKFGLNLRYGKTPILRYCLHNEHGGELHKRVFGGDKRALPNSIDVSGFISEFFEEAKYILETKYYLNTKNTGDSPRFINSETGNEYLKT